MLSLEGRWLEGRVERHGGCLSFCARLRDAWMAEAILRHIAQTKLALEQARHAYVAAVSNLTKAQQKEEVLRLMGPGGLVVQVLISGRRPDETHCCDSCFFMHLQRAAEELRKRTEVSPQHRDKSD